MNRLLMLALGAAGAACSTVDLGAPPADVNACRPSQQFFIDEIWTNFLDKDYGGKHCYDSSCHSVSSGRPLSLIAMPMPIATPTMPVPIPLQDDWAANYKSVSENMQCSNVRSSPLLVNPSGVVPHGGGKLIEPNGPEATLIQMWVTQP